MKIKRRTHGKIVKDGKDLIYIRLLGSSRPAFSCLKYTDRLCSC